MYKVFTSKKKIIFSYNKAKSYDCVKRTVLDTAKEIFSCEENHFTIEMKSIEEIYKMVTEGFVFFPINEKTEASDIKKYIEMGFKVAFLRAGDFKKLKKDYKDFI